MHSRRAFLQVALGLTGVTSLLAACAPTTTPAAAPTTPPRAAQANDCAAPPPRRRAAAQPTAPPAATTPTNAPAGGSTGAPVAADGKLPSPMVGVPDGFTKLPPITRTYDGVPGRGGKVNVFTIAYQPPPSPRESNRMWQELEKRLGVTWEPIITPQPDYGSKSAALLAGGNLPELFYLNPGQNATAQYQAMDQGAFTDLTPYVTGDALKSYKNLSSFPAYMWDNVKFKGKVVGVPKPLQRNGNVGFVRADWMKKLGKELAQEHGRIARLCSSPSPKAIPTAMARLIPGASAATGAIRPAGTTRAS